MKPILVLFFFWGGGCQCSTLRFYDMETRILTGYIDIFFSLFFFRTLYCAKGNYEFGISRVIKSLEPYNKKLGTDTWYYAKRCFLSLIENMAKHMIMMKDQVVQECIQFLECCESKCSMVSARVRERERERGGCCRQNYVKIRTYIVF